MDWITGIQNAINYIEDHLTDDLDYERIAKESFAKAFQKFHGITPSQARGGGVRLKSFSRLSIKVSLEGGSIMNYRIEQKKPLLLFGYKAHFTGSPMERRLQDHNFICDIRLKHAALQYMAHDVDTTYCVMDNLNDDGYDYMVASYLGEDDRQDLLDCFGEEVADWFEKIVIPGGTYLVREGERCQYPANYADDLYREAVSNHLPGSGYELIQGPEVEILHWYYKEGDEKLNSSRYLELWLPIAKKYT